MTADLAEPASVRANAARSTITSCIPGDSRDIVFTQTRT